MRRLLSILLTLSIAAHAQTGGGVSTGKAHAPVLDGRHRPITAGGYVSSGDPIFQDVTRAAGLAGWQHHVGTADRMFISESLGSGVALLDFDGDGWLDIYLVNGSTVEAMAGKSESPHAALFRNNHDGTFSDVTKAAGVANDRWGVGAIAADFDNDGWPDLYVTNLGRNRLYHNNHNGTFTDIPPAPPRATMMATAGWTCSSLATQPLTSQTHQGLARIRLLPTPVPFVV